MNHQESSPPRPQADRDALDPAGWDRAEVEEALDSRRIDQDHQGAAATGTGAMLVGSTGPFATLAGRHALEAGGSATDAVLATAFTQIALSLGSWVSYAGLFGVVQYDAASNETTTVSAGFGTFARETDPATIPAAPQPSGRTALVPGFIAGAAAAHERAGRLPWDRLWSPARDLIARGVPISNHLERLLDARESTLTRTPSGRAAFAPDGRLPRSGDRFRQPQLADTVDALAEHGPEWMYRGPWAEHFVDAVRRDGGQVTIEDLADYAPMCGDPARGRFAGHEIATLPAPDAGGLELLAALQRLDALKVGEPTEDPAALIGLLMGLGDAQNPGSHSDYVVAVDAEGNVAALCHSINTAMWGTTGIVVDGVPIPDPAAFQQAALASFSPGDHLPMPIEPAIAFHDQKPVLACSSIGVGLHPATVLSLHRVLALGHPIATAVDEPLIHAYDIAIGDSVTSILAQAEAGPISRVVDERFSDDIVAAARDAGFLVRPRSADDKTLPRGFWAAIGTDPLTGQHSGGRTPYGQGPVRCAR